MKLLDGSHREDRDGRPLATAAGLPVKPGWLDEVASKVWDQTVGELSQIDGLLSPLDMPMLAIYCSAWSLFHKAREQLEREGLTIKGREGALVKHPAVVVKKQAVDMITSIAGKFGLTPASRASLAIDTVNALEGVRRRGRHFKNADNELADLIQ
jgi:P27 family predicted phage terminase small subunit